MVRVRRSQRIILFPRLIQRSTAASSLGAHSAVKSSPPLVRGTDHPFTAKQVFGFAPGTGGLGMMRTRTGLNGRPTCRPGVICPGLGAPKGWPRAAMSAGLPAGTPRSCFASTVNQCGAPSLLETALAVGQPFRTPAKINRSRKSSEKS